MVLSSIIFSLALYFSCDVIKFFNRDKCTLDLNYYDFESLIKGVAVLNGKYQYKLFFIGDGVCRAKIENLISQYSVNAEITGFMEYGDLLKYLANCDIAVNIFRDKTKVVHSYKFNDYVATNCFILNSLPGETADMIDRYKVGLNFDFKDNTFD